MIVRELVTLLGFDLDEATAKKYEQRLDRMQTKAGKVVDALDRSAAKAMKNVGAAAVKLTASAVAGATAAGAAATAVFAKSIGDIEEMARGIEISGLDASTFQTWATVATDEFGWGVDKFADVMKDVNDRVGQLIGENSGELKGLVDAYGKKAGMGAQDFVGEDAVGTIAKVAEMLKRAGANQAQITAAGEALADDGSILLKMAMRENGELERKLDLARQGLMLSEDEIKAAKELQTARRRMTSWFDDVRFKISAGLAPALTALLDKWNAWLVANKELVSLRIEQAIGIGTRAIDRMASIVDKVGSAFTWVTEKVGGFENAVRTLSAFMTGALVAAGAAFLVWIAPSLPWLFAAGVLLTGLGYAVQDLYTYMTGGESVIGAFIEYLERLANTPPGELTNWQKLLADFYRDVKATAAEVERLIGVWNKWMNRPAEAPKEGEAQDGWLKRNAKAAKELAGDIGNALFERTDNGGLIGIVEGLAGAGDEAADKLGTQLGGAADKVETKWDGAASGMERAFGSAIDGMDGRLQAFEDRVNGITLAPRLNLREAPMVPGGDGTLQPAMPGYASGTNNAGRGLAIVGENGPEVVRFGGGEQVIPAAPSSRMLEKLAANARGFAQRAADFGERFAADFGGMQGRLAAPGLGAGGATPNPAAGLHPVGSGQGGGIGPISITNNIEVNATDLRPGSSPEDIARVLEGKMEGIAERTLSKEIRRATRHFTEQE